MSKFRVPELKKKKKHKKSEDCADIDPYIAAEDKEIKRLEKLLGFSYDKESNKRVVAEKLNKEYEENEVSVKCSRFVYGDIGNRRRIW